MVTKLTTEYSSLTNGFRTGQRYDKGKRDFKPKVHLGTPGLSYDIYTHPSLCSLGVRQSLVGCFHD